MLAGCVPHGCNNAIASSFTLQGAGYIRTCRGHLMERPCGGDWEFVLEKREPNQDRLWAGGGEVERDLAHMRVCV